MQGVWEQLGINPTRDEREIRRAYARRLKLVHPEDDPEEFQRLRAAYEAAMASARWDESPSYEGLADPDRKIAHPDADHPDREPDEHAQDSSDFKDHNPLLSSLDIPDADRLVRHLLSILRSEGEQAAIYQLVRLKDSPEMENLETQDDFEILLARAVSQMDRTPYLLIASIVDFFNIEFRSSLVNSRLTYWHSILLSHLETARCYQRLLQTAGTKRPPPKKDSSRPAFLPLDVPTEDQIFAAQILTGPFDLKKFRRIARWPGQRRPVLHLLARLKGNHPDLVRHVLDPEIVGWWQRLADSRWTLLHNTCRDSIGKVLRILFIGGGLTILAFGLIYEPDLGWFILEVATLTPIAIVLCWDLYLKNTNVGRRYSRFWRALRSGKSR